MTRTRWYSLPSLLLALAAAALSGCASKEPSVTEWDGLILQPNTRLGAVFILPGADIASFKSVLLDPVQISFASDWNPNRAGSATGRVTPADIATLKSGLAELFRETFREQLARSGYPLVDVEGPDTLRVTPAIINLYVTAPAAATAGAGRSRVFTATSGRMTLVAEVRDSVTNELLARAVDAQSARSGAGQLTWTNAVTNRSDARRAINVWAASLVRGLDGITGKPVAPEAAAEAAAPAS
jgi:Protein of unknown function (DUF3313)